MIRAAIVTSNRRLRRQVTRALASIGWEVDAFPLNRDQIELKPGDFALYVIDADYEVADIQWLLNTLGAKCPDASSLLLSYEMESKMVVDLLAADVVNNYFGLSTSSESIDESELMVTCQKLVSRQIFGLDKYLTTWGMKTYNHTVQSTTDKDKVVSAFEDFLGRIDCYGRIIAPISMVAEELLMNALFNAPTDENGKHKYSDIDRRDPLTVKPEEAVSFDYACDGRYVGIAVRDRFGTLNRSVVIDYLRRSFLGEQGQVQSGSSAGLGLFMVFNSITQLSFNIEAGKQTEVVALFYIRDGVRAFKTSGRSLHIFLLQ